MDQNTTKKPRFPRIRSDFHMHSYHSGDSDTPMEDQIRAALSLGQIYGQPLPGPVLRLFYGTPGYGLALSEYAGPGSGYL